MNRVNTDAVLRLLQVSPKVRTLHLTVCDGIDSSAWCAHIAARPGGYDRVSVHIESYAVPNLLTALRTWEALKDRVVFMVTVSVVGVSFTEDAKGWPQAARIMDRLEIREMHLSNTLNPAVFGNHTAQTLEVFRWGGVMCSCNSDIRAFLRLFRDGTLRMRRYRDSREILQ